MKKIIIYSAIIIIAYRLYDKFIANNKQVNQGKVSSDIEPSSNTPTISGSTYGIKQ
jgi:hypothetical protein